LYSRYRRNNYRNCQIFKRKNPNIKIWAIDVQGSLLTNYFKTGEIDMSFVHPYISEGFGEDFVPQNYDMSVIDYFEQVSDKDGAIMARKLPKKKAYFVVIVQEVVCKD
jgi:cystathionine beta-synthase